MAIILGIIGVCLLIGGTYAVSCILKALTQIVTTTESLNTSIDRIGAEIQLLKPINLDELSFLDLTKEAKRREMYINQFSENLINIVAAGIGKAFKK